MMKGKIVLQSVIMLSGPRACTLRAPHTLNVIQKENGAGQMAHRLRALAAFQEEVGFGPSAHLVAHSSL